MFWLNVGEIILAVAIFIVSLRVELLAKKYLKLFAQINGVLQAQQTFNAMVVEAIKPKTRKKAE